MNPHDNENEDYGGFINEELVQTNSNNIAMSNDNGPKPTSPSYPSKEETLIWDLEVWKRAEQTKFKAYLKQLEYEFLNRLSEEYKHKEEERDKEIKSKINELNVLQTRLKKKASELETRENKLNLLEEELKIRINEVARQLTNKEEEISYIKKRFKEEKTLLEKDKLSLTKQCSEKDKIIETIENNFRNYKKEVDDSPLSVLKNELNRKILELEDSNREVSRLINEGGKYKSQCEKLKLDLVKMKKAFDQEKELLYKQKIDEIEKLKFEIYNQKMSQNELAELQDLRNKVKYLTEREEVKECGGGTMAIPTPIQQKIGQKKEYKIIHMKKNSNSSIVKIRNSDRDISSELEKLYNERNSLLNNGMYFESDPLILQIDNRIRKLLEMEN
jgi:hypothetical protein